MADGYHHYVYVHKFPNGKVYVGKGNSSPTRRWQNGKGYVSNPEMNSDIEKYGWDNIVHLIIGNRLTKHEAIELEKEMIIKYDSENPEKGYNRSHLVSENGADWMSILTASSKLGITKNSFKARMYYAPQRLIRRENDNRIFVHKDILPIIEEREKNESINKR